MVVSPGDDREMQSVIVMVAAKSEGESSQKTLAARRSWIEDVKQSTGDTSRQACRASDAERGAV
jgi:hypothetical protein